MFSIAAINDTDSKTEWQPLAPTKEAQEFHLSQLYHDGLLKLQAKDYVKARELLETVLKDPLVANAKVEKSASDGHLLQLRYLALKNLATVALEQGPSHHETALQCYLQAVEIDDKDSVVWNQLGTLSCSMGSLSISRWAFEQGLVCSPSNWNCMEKLLEVLIAIGDEVACLAVAELILKHWPSHSRALHVKSTIEEPEPIPFAPKGIDKLEPKHKRLNFPDKRKETDEELDKNLASKKLQNYIEVQLLDVSWVALARELVNILCPTSPSCDASQYESCVFKNVRLIIQLPSNSSKVNDNVAMGEITSTSAGEGISFGKVVSLNDKEESTIEEQPQERRSTRLERRRTRKSGKDESDFSSNKDRAKVVKQYLAPYLVGGTGTTKCSESLHGASAIYYSLDSESTDVIEFIQDNSKNFGAYHMSHVLLEKIANKSISYPDELYSLILDLEKVTRNWGQERSPECSLFLSELYYDLALKSSAMSTKRSFMEEVCYHVCKIIEHVALEIADRRHSAMADVAEANQHLLLENPLLLKNSHCFWIRYYWLSGRLSLSEGDKEKAQKEFSVALSLFIDKDEPSKPFDSIVLAHCKVLRNLTLFIILHEAYMIEVDYLLKSCIRDMFEKNMYAECVNTLAPLLLLEKDVHLDVLHALDHEGKGFNAVELPALDILIKSCELTEPMDVRLYFSSHRRKLHILISAASLEGSSTDNVPCQNVFSSSESQPKESQLKQWNLLVAEEVKAISQSASKIKSINDSNIPMDIIGDIQSLLLALMCNIANSYLGRKSSVLGVTGQREEYFFVDAAIAFCKLQHWNLNATIKSQTELIVAIHDMLAEFGICCARGNGEEEEGRFLKLAIKHLLSLDMKLKSNTHTHSKEKEMKLDEYISSNDHGQVPGQQSQNTNLTTNESDSHVHAMEVNDTKDETGSLVNDAVEGLCSKYVSSSLDEPERDKRLSGDRHDDSSNCRIDLTEDEQEELELSIDSALDQCFYCLYGLNLRSDSSSEEDLVSHKNTCQGDYQTKEQCADVFQYILPYAKASSRTGLVKLRKVLRAIRKHFPQPPDNVLAGNAIDKFLDDPRLCEDKLSDKVGSDGFLNYIMRIMYPDGQIPKQHNTSSAGSCDAYLEVYQNLYYLIAQSEEISATDKWAGFILTKEGEEFVEHNTNLFKYDLLYNPLRFESWQGLANIYDEEVDLLLNDGSKQINVSGWKKNATLPGRVETSRRRSRRCLLMTSALAKTQTQQGEIHELLALVYYDGLQNVVPFYDQRSCIPLKDAAWEMFCQNSMNHFKKAFQLKEDWSHKYYVGKLCEKLGYSVDISLSNYAEAISLNPSAVDPFYRMHASRLKLLGRCGKQDIEAVKAITEHSFTQSTRESVMDIFHGLIGCESSESPMQVEDGNHNNNSMMVNSHKFDEAWKLLYSDCLSALETCVEGDLKHFHKARYILAQGLYRRGGVGDLEKAKEELSFCFKSSRSSFTINMWEIDSTVKKGRRKTPSTSGNKRALEVNLPESSRKFITCIRKYILFYLKLLEETGDIFTLERAYTSLRTDKRFSLCLEDLVPLTLGRYIKALIMTVNQPGTGSNATTNSVEQALEKLFNLFLDQVNLWSDICNLPELKSPELSESSLYGYLYQYIQLLEINVKVEVLEAINEKIRKRLKNPKLSNSNCAKVYRHVSSAWCRSLVISMALITPLHSRPSTKILNMNLLSGGLESEQLLCVDLQSEELWSSAFEDSNHLKVLETKWNSSLSKIKNVIIKRASDEDLESAATVLRSSYNFYKDTSCALLPSGINLYTVPSQLGTETYIQPGIDGVDIIDMNTSRKLLLWAYSLLNGHCTHVSHVIKYCEENVKSRMKKGTGSVLASSTANAQTANTSQPGGIKDVLCKSSEQEEQSPNPGIHAPVLQTHSSSSTLTTPHAENTGNRPSDPQRGTGTTFTAHAESSPVCGQSSSMNVLSAAAQRLVPCKNPVVENTSSSLDLQNDAEKQETID